MNEQERKAFNDWVRNTLVEKLIKKPGEKIVLRSEIWGKFQDKDKELFKSNVTKFREAVKKYAEQHPQPPRNGGAPAVPPPAPAGGNAWQARQAASGAQQDKHINDPIVRKIASVIVNMAAVVQQGGTKPLTVAEIQRSGLFELVPLFKSVVDDYTASKGVFSGIDKDKVQSYQPFLQLYRVVSGQTKREVIEQISRENPGEGSSYMVFYNLFQDTQAMCIYIAPEGVFDNINQSLFISNFQYMMHRFRDLVKGILDETAQARAAMQTDQAAAAAASRVLPVPVHSAQEVTQEVGRMYGNHQPIPALPRPALEPAMFAFLRMLEIEDQIQDKSGSDIALKLLEKVGFIALGRENAHKILRSTEEFDRIVKKYKEQKKPHPAPPAAGRGYPRLFFVDYRLPPGAYGHPAAGLIPPGAYGHPAAGVIPPGAYGHPAAGLIPPGAYGHPAAGGVPQAAGGAAIAGGDRVIPNVPYLAPVPRGFNTENPPAVASVGRGHGPPRRPGPADADGFMPNHRPPATSRPLPDAPPVVTVNPFDAFENAASSRASSARSTPSVVPADAAQTPPAAAGAGGSRLSSASGEGSRQSSASGEGSRHSPASSVGSVRRSVRGEVTAVTAGPDEPPKASEETGGGDNGEPLPGTRSGDDCDPSDPDSKKDCIVQAKMPSVRKAGSDFDRLSARYGGY